MGRILIVGDEAASRARLERVLRREGMEVESVGTGGAAFEKRRAAVPFDLVVLDAELQSASGIGVCEELCSGGAVPVVTFAHRGDELSVVAALEAGADDCIAKPFRPRELVSRVRARLRRRRACRRTDERRKLGFDGLEIDLWRHEVLAQGIPVKLTCVQFKILTLLASRPGVVFSRRQIMEPVWGSGLSNGSRAADVHINNIRRRIEPDPQNPRYIRTVRSMGYRLVEPDRSISAPQLSHEV